jgi:putative redox protein
MTSEVIYKGALRTECKHLRSGNTILTDAPIDNKGKGETFSPTDLVATSLAACILTTIGIKTEEKGLDITGAKADVEKVMASDPRRISEINMKIYMPANGYSDKEKVLIEKIAAHCPVGRSLNADLKENMEIIWL